MGWFVPHWTLADRILRGEPIIVHDQGRTFWTATHSDDFAYAFCGLAGNLDAVGQSFHITNDDPLLEGLQRSINWYRANPNAMLIDDANNQLTNQIILAWQNVLKG